MPTPTPPEEMEKLAMYLAASPLFVDLERPEETETIDDRFDNLPQNIRGVLASEDTAARIWNLAIGKHRLSAEQVKVIARAVRDVLTGRAPANAFRASLQERLGAPAATTENIVQILTREFIAPNYFQIQKLSERKAPKGAATPAPPATPPPPADRPPGNVVDLRGGEPAHPLPPASPPVPPPPRPGPERPRPVLRGKPLEA